jgi:hypothetical protein
MRKVSINCSGKMPEEIVKSQTQCFNNVNSYEGETENKWLCSCFHLKNSDIQETN